MPHHPSRPATRLSIAAIFFVHGIVQGSWVPHIPLAQARLGLDLATFGWALLTLACGAVGAMPATGALINRYGSAPVTAATSVFFCLAFALPVLAPNVPMFILGLAVFGIGIGSMDVAMNAHGLAFETQTRFPVMSFFHGTYSVGAMTGAGASAVLLTNLSEAAHVAVAIAAGLAFLAVALQFLLPAAADRGGGGTHFAWPTRATIGLGSLCFLVLMSEGAVLDWSAIHLKRAFGLDAHVAALGYAMFAGGMATARFTGDYLRARFGSVPLVRWSAVLSALGLAGALFLPSPGLAILAYAFGGLGIGNIVPVLFGGGGRLEPDAPGRGIAAVVAMGYAGFVAGPPFIGMIAELAGLSIALGITVLASATIAATARIARAADLE